MNCKLSIPFTLLLVLSLTNVLSQSSPYDFRRPIYGEGTNTKYFGLGFDLLYDIEQFGSSQTTPEFLLSLRHVKMKGNGFGIGFVVKGGILDQQPGAITTSKNYLVSAGAVMEADFWRKAPINPYLTMHSSLGYSWESISEGQISGILEPGVGFNLLMVEKFRLGFEVRTLLNFEIDTFSESYLEPDVFRGVMFGMTMKFGDNYVNHNERRKQRSRS